MIKDENSDMKQEINFKSGVINVIENHIENLRAEKKEGVQDFFRNLKSFIGNLKTYHLNKVDSTKSNNSLLSMMDIKVEILDYKPQYRDFGCNTNESDSCDANIQTTKPRTGVVPDYVNDLYFLRAQTIEANDELTIFMAKKEQLSIVKDVAYEKLASLAQLYDPSSDKQRRQSSSVATETCESWIKQWDALIEQRDRCCEAKEQLTAARTRNEELEELSCRKQQIVERGFEMMEELTNINEEWRGMTETLAVEVCEAREMNEFHEDEHQTLTATVERLHDEFVANVASGEERLRESMVAFRADRSRWLAERRGYGYKLSDDEGELTLERRRLAHYAREVQEMGESVCNYPLYGKEGDKLAVTKMRIRLTMMEDECLCVTQEKELMEDDREYLGRRIGDGQEERRVEHEDHYLVENTRTLIEECDALDQDLLAANQQRDTYKACFDELCEAFANEEERGASVDLCRQLMAKYGL